MNEFIIVLTITIYVFIGIFIGALTTEKDDYDRDDIITISVIIWPFVIVAVLFIGFYNLVIKLADFLKNK